MFRRITQSFLAVALGAVLLLGSPTLALGAPLPIAKYLDQPDAWFAGDEGRALLEVILSQQKKSGGWWKQYDTSKVRSPEAAAKDDQPSIFDNDATTSELRILARAVRVTQKPEYRAAFDRGLQMTLAAQYANGGWPQEYPVPARGYGMQITFNDDAMVRILKLLRDIGSGSRADFSFVDEATRARCREAFEKGIGCILAAQIRVNGQPAVWCAQYDEKTLTPAKARAYELPSFSGGESMQIAQLLMSIENPTDPIKQAVRGAAQWYEDHKIVGVREDRIPNSASPKGYDVVHVADANAEVRWGRFYDLDTGRPYFCGRDGVKKERLADIEMERRAGYAWFRPWGKPILDAYPAWAAKNGVAPIKPSQGLQLPL